MNKWIQKSIKLAQSRGYLDKLMDIYPVNLNLTRSISANKREEIRKTFTKKNYKQLINVLLKLERFPFDDPYIGFFRKDRGALNRNPETVKRIGKRLFEMGINEILIGATREKASSRQIGQMFRSWLHKLGYPVLRKEEFSKYKKTAILEGSDAVLKEFAKENLNYKGQKGLDLVLRIGDRFFIGEVKFITTSGGTQDKSFREGVSFIKKKSGNTTSIAILDGVIWLVSQKVLTKKKKPSLYESILKLKNKELVFSALFLKEFIRQNESSKN